MCQGEMSEKLSRCRKELAAAIDRAMEDLSVPLHHSPDSTTNLNLDLLTVESLKPSSADLNTQRGEPTLPIVCFSQQPLTDSSVPEKENPLFKPNLTSVITASNIPSSKREPLISKENTCLHPPVFMTERQIFIGKIDERSAKPDPSATDVLQECPKDLTDMGGNTAVSPAEKVPRKVDFDELQQISKLSRELLPPDEASAFGVEIRSSFRGVPENSPEDEEIIETLLDMEEDYRLNSSTLHQLP
ncbi:uncharacterized protein C3orf62 homolog [Eublepharis macularius]|uniref:Uncharacterized protein C3orf62 homolog n=1 Tax=Eublepharis macularius TaxID=481883 RepID=A0AA97JBC2_EUBMA|nr:uncharacterized protein C3orf62 homolog [Eublepharis macularius]